MIHFNVFIEALFIRAEIQNQLIVHGHTIKQNVQPLNPATQEAERGRRILIQGQQGKSECETPHVKQSKKKQKDWGVAQVIAYMPSKHKALSSIPRT
jgi:hypothetical protein